MTSATAWAGAAATDPNGTRRPTDGTGNDTGASDETATEPTIDGSVFSAEFRDAMRSKPLVALHLAIVSVMLGPLATFKADENTKSMLEQWQEIGAKAPGHFATFCDLCAFVLTASAIGPSRYEALKQTLPVHRDQREFVFCPDDSTLASGRVDTHSDTWVGVSSDADPNEMAKFRATLREWGRAGSPGSVAQIKFNNPLAHTFVLEWVGQVDAREPAPDVGENEVSGADVCVLLHQAYEGLYKMNTQLHRLSDVIAILQRGLDGLLSVEDTRLWLPRPAVSDAQMEERAEHHESYRTIEVLGALCFAGRSGDIDEHYEVLQSVPTVVEASTSAPASGAITPYPALR